MKEWINKNFSLILMSACIAVLMFGYWDYWNASPWYLKIILFLFAVGVLELAKQDDKYREMLEIKDGQIKSQGRHIDELNKRY